jgi:hypothetical protein
MLSTIILKLLEKHPDNRYQTVDGLIADLRRCQATLTCEGEIVAFTPGQQDRTPAIHLADSLFATHPQANDVIAAFERVGQNLVPELVTIGGPSGIGKSSIIATALKTLQQRTVLLAVGKVDQFSPSLPYGVLSSAFRTLTLHLLGLPADEVAKWKIRLSRALEGTRRWPSAWCPSWACCWRASRASRRIRFPLMPGRASAIWCWRW